MDNSNFIFPATITSFDMAGHICTLVRQKQPKLCCVLQCATARLLANATRTLRARQYFKAARLKHVRKHPEMIKTFRESTFWPDFTHPKCNRSLDMIKMNHIVKFQKWTTLNKEIMTVFRINLLECLGEFRLKMFQCWPIKGNLSL